MRPIAGGWCLGDSTKSILTNPKVDIVVDDGRRWLRRHPDRMFDAVIVNTTFHWQEHASSLLSREFMELIKAHLKPGGVFQFNTTGLIEPLTATEVFEDAYLFVNNVVASNRPLTFDKSVGVKAPRVSHRWSPVFTPERYNEIVRLFQCSITSVIEAWNNTVIAHHRANS